MGAEQHLKYQVNYYVNEKAILNNCCTNEYSLIINLVGLGRKGKRWNLMLDIAIKFLELILKYQKKFL